MVKVFGPGVERSGLKANEPTHFTVDCSGAGDGKTNSITVCPHSTRRTSTLCNHIDTFGRKGFIRRLNKYSMLKRPLAGAGVG